MRKISLFLSLLFVLALTNLVSAAPIYFEDLKTWDGKELGEDWYTYNHQVTLANGEVVSEAFLALVIKNKNDEDDGEVKFKLDLNQTGSFSVEQETTNSQTIDIDELLLIDGTLQAWVCGL